MVVEVDMNARPGIQGVPLMPVAFVCFLALGIYGGGLRLVLALKGLVLESEEVGDPICTLHHGESLEGGGGVLGVCDGWVVEVEEDNCGFRGRWPGL